MTVAESLRFILEILLVIIGFSLGVLFLEFISYIFRPKKGFNPIKNEIYECGEIPEGIRRGHIFFQYYKYAIAFTALDIFTIYFILFSVAFKIMSISFIFIFAVISLIFSMYVFKRAEYKVRDNGAD